MKPLFLVLAALLTAYPALAQKEVLRSRWEPGKVYKQENVTNMTATVPDSAEVQKTAVTQSFEVRVTAEPATGNKLAALTITGTKATMDMMGQSLTYDSADPAKSPPTLQQAFGTMLNKSFTLVYDKDDKFVETRGLEKLMATPLGNTTGMDGKQLSEAFRKSYEMSLPKDAVAVGDTWTIEDTLEMAPVVMVVKAKGKYDSVVEIQGRKHARLVIEGTFGTPANSASPFTLGEGSKFSGEVLFDLQRRVIVANESRTEINLQVQGQTVPMKQTVLMRLVSLEDAK
ncbi:MAG: DUF6263 family protein [Roseimicrobium sp.]